MHISASPRRATVRMNRGFTILELLIVIGIMVALGGIVAINLMGQSDKADVQITKVSIQTLEQGLDGFKIDMKRLPTEDEGIAVLWNKDMLEDEDNASKWSGPYIKEPKPKDTWGFEWIYRSPSEVEGVAFDLVSIGPDGEEGTEDDISNLDGRLGADGESLDDDFSDFAPSN